MQHGPTGKKTQVWLEKTQVLSAKKLRFDEKNSGSVDEKLRFSEIIWSGESRKSAQKKSLSTSFW